MSKVKKNVKNDLLISVILFIFGFWLFSLVKDENTWLTSGYLILIILAASYLSLGIGLYGIFKWLIRNGLRLFIYLIRMILWGNIEVTIAKEKVSFKPYFRK